MKKVIIICGPTASYKSAFAIKLAASIGGEIINCDSMQVYAEIPVITASPSLEDKLLIKHHLYNYIPVTERFSAGKYVVDAMQAVQNVSNLDKVPIIVGGTGMYINALIKPFTAIPPISPQVKIEVDELLTSRGLEGLYEKLCAFDAAAASTILPNDKQRIVRSYEVYIETGQSLSRLHQTHARPAALNDYNIQVIMLLPERQWLYENCNKRFKLLVETGALEEVKTCLPIMHQMPTASCALGLKELAEFLEGRVSLSEAIEQASLKTRQYAKRQCTWFNNQIAEKLVLRYNTTEELLSYIGHLS